MLLDEAAPVAGGRLLPFEGGPVEIRELTADVNSPYVSRVLNLLAIIVDSTNKLYILNLK